ncbi:cytochrome P450 [Auricularia subglabra TFB-10046 SS5]|nr:cytochrome P450 [Auricularia subglabra TFB-10046 SS5]
MHRHFNESAVADLWPEISRINSVFLGLLLRSPLKFWEHARWLAGSNVMSIAYGIETRIDDDPYLHLGREAAQILSKAGAQGAYLVDILHILKHLPEWFPGMGFKRQAREWKALQLRARDQPFDFVKQEMASGTARGSMTSRLLSGEFGAVPEDAIRNSAGVVYFGKSALLPIDRALIDDSCIAGVDTTAVVMQAFFLAMVLYPGTQRAAQAELDAFMLLQGGRMPQLTDRPALPYVTAVLHEVIRSYPPAPLGVPHRLMQDDVYRGMHIPENAFIVPNVWAMLHDTVYYPSPEKFDPNRFIGADGQLDTAVLNPAHIVFGFGRRVCPGRYLSMDEVWLMIATTLYSFDIAPGKDADGVDIRPSEFMSPGIISMLTRFNCNITPRSPAKQALVEAVI